ncbi:hypothetical protein ES705_43881 [subsurface metagenome]
MGGVSRLETRRILDVLEVPRHVWQLHEDEVLPESGRMIEILYLRLRWKVGMIRLRWAVFRMRLFWWKVRILEWKKQKQ